jgi:hypothetical protein
MPKSDIFRLDRPSLVEGPKKLGDCGIFANCQRFRGEKAEGTANGIESV